MLLWRLCRCFYVRVAGILSQMEIIVRWCMTILWPEQG